MFWGAVEPGPWAPGLSSFGNTYPTDALHPDHPVLEGLVEMPPPLGSLP